MPSHENDSGIPEGEDAVTQAANSDSHGTPFSTGTGLGDSHADGRYFGRYRVERELGRGGMGIVMLAHDEELDIPVALKLLPEAVSGDAEGIARFKSEVLRGMTLAHPNIVRVHTFERNPRHAAIVMEYVPGDTLADLKAAQPGHCFDCTEIIPWIEQLCTALDYAHAEAHVAHRDLKPRNIMLTPDGRLKITDFGLASLLTESLTRVATQPGAVGTPPYMSPQQVLGKPATRVDDLYAVGASIYDLLTGRPPFFRGDVFAQVLHEEAPSMTQRRKELGVSDKAPIPPSWERAVAACLAKDAINRPSSGAALVAMLREDAVAMSSVVSVKVGTRKPRDAARTATAPVIERYDTTKSASVPIPAVKLTATRSEPLTYVQAIRRHRQSSGFMKFVIDVFFTLVMAAVAAGGVRVARHLVPSKVAAAPAAIESQAAPTPQRRGMLHNATLQTAKQLQTSSLEQPAPNRGSRR